MITSKSNCRSVQLIQALRLDEHTDCTGWNARAKRTGEACRVYQTTRCQNRPLERERARSKLGLNVCLNQSRGGAGLLDNLTRPQGGSFHCNLRIPRSVAPGYFSAAGSCRHLKAGKTKTKFVGAPHSKPPSCPPPTALSTPDPFLTLAAQSSHSLPFPSQVSRCTTPSLLPQLSLRPQISAGPPR